MNRQYILTGQNNYKIEGIFGPNDQILPLNSHISNMKSLLNQNFLTPNSNNHMDVSLNENSVITQAQSPDMGMSFDPNK
jgi:hypothetical protein